MAVILNSHKLLFIHIPKNAGSSISQWLLNHGGQYTGAIRHSALEDSGVNVTDYYSFCVVRNPWDRMTSLYRYALRVSNQVGISFRSWLEQNYKFSKHWYSISTPQADWIKTEPNLIMRYENLEQDFKYIQSKVNSQQALSLINTTTKNQHYSLYYDDWSKNFVGELYLKDIERFNYKFNAAE